MATVKFRVINSQGEPVANSIAGFKIKDFGEVFKKSEANIITITGFKEGKYIVDISTKEYEKESVEIEIVDPNIVIDRTIVLR